MKKQMRLLALLLVPVMAVSLLAGCGGGMQAGGKAPQSVTAGEPQYGGHINVRINSRPTGLDPLNQTGSFRYLYMTAVFEPALTRDADYAICPSVCDYTLSEDMLDLKLWVRDGYSFSTGEAVDIYDVEASINRGLKQNTSMKKYVQPFVSSIGVENDGEKDILHIVFSQYKEKCMYYLAAPETWCPVMPKEIAEKYMGSYIIDQIEDAIGTGPYVFTDFDDSVSVTITRREDYTPVDNSAYSGTAGTKYAYLDSMSFFYNSTDASACLALLAGDYDMTEVLPAEYIQMAKDQGIVLSVMPSDQRTWVYFNTRGTNNLCAKYPSLRKAVMAAIDYEGFLDVICDGSQIFEGENAHMIVGSKYPTDAFTSQDYYGPANQEVVDKYLNEARAEGYKDEPLQIVFETARNDTNTLLAAAMDGCSIPYEPVVGEAGQIGSFRSDPSNNWDFYFGWGVSSYTPSLLSDAIVENNYKSDVKDQLREEMYSLDPNSEEYMAKWQELAQHTAEGCYIGFMSAIDWWWWHPSTLHVNNDEGRFRFMYNAYWDDPANHPKR